MFLKPVSKSSDRKATLGTYILQCDCLKLQTPVFQLHKFDEVIFVLHLLEIEGINEVKKERNYKQLFNSA